MGDPFEEKETVHRFGVPARVCVLLVLTTALGLIPPFLLSLYYGVFYSIPVSEDIEKVPFKDAIPWFFTIILINLAIIIGTVALSRIRALLKHLRKREERKLVRLEKIAEKEGSVGNMTSKAWKWIRSPWKYLFATVVAVVVVCPFYVSRLFDTGERVTWSTLSLAPAAFAYAWVFAMVYTFILGIIVWQLLCAAGYVFSFGRKLDFKIQPLHPDRCGGLGQIGKVMLSIDLLVLLAGLYLALGLLTYRPEFRGMVTTALVGYLVGLPLIVFLPLTPYHSRMKRSKEILMKELVRDYYRIPVVSRYVDIAPKPDDSSLGDSTSSLPMLAGVDSGEILELYNLVDAMPTWPFDTKTVLKYLGLLSSPALSLIFEFVRI